MSLILLSLPVKGQVLPDEEMDHPTQVQPQNLKQPVRDVEIKNNSPVSWSCFPSGSRLSAFCFFTNPERRNCSGWGALQCNKGGLKLPLNARRPYCQGTSPQPGQGGGVGRERREEWRRHQPVECSVNFCSVQWLCSSKTMRIYLKKKNLQLLKSQLQSSFSEWVVLKKAAHSREWSETFTPLFTAIDTWIDP